MGTRLGADKPFAPKDPNKLTAKFTRAKPLEDQRVLLRERLLQEHGSGMATSQSPAQMELDEDDTQDSFMKRIIREDNKGHGRALSEQVGTTQAFRKARTRPRTGLTIENLARHTFVASPAPPEVTSKSSLGSVSSSKTDPPLNVPHEWGRKAKRNPQWIRRIHTDNPALHMNMGVNGHVDWQQAAAEIPLPSMEVDDSPLSRSSSRRGMTRRRISPSPGDDDEALSSDDFNESDILSSTPAPRKSMKVDEIRQLELDAELEDSTVYPTPPREKSRSRSRPRTPPAVQPADDPRIKSTDELGENNPKPAAKDRAISQISKEQLTSTHPPKPDKNSPPSPISVAHKSIHTVGDIDRKVVPNIQATPRPQNRREDSRDILRKLSRTPSATPSPGMARSLKPSSIPVPTSTNQNGNDKQTISRAYSHRLREPFSHRLEKSSFNRVNEPGRDIAAGRSDTHDITTAVLDTNAKQVVSQSSSIDHVDDALPSKVNPPKTPIVSGAWVDTIIEPETTFKNQSVSDGSTRISPPTSPAKEEAAATEPALAKENSGNSKHPVHLPTSALEAVLAKAHQSGDDALGEATINSLQDLVDTPVDPSATGDIENDTIENLEIPSGKPRTVAEKQRLDELLRIKKMNQRINKLQGDMHSMHRGVSNIEKMAQPPVTKSLVPEVKKTAKQVVSSVIVADCKTCEDPAKTLVSGLRQIFWVYRRDATSVKGFRLGPGFWVLLVLSVIPYVLMELIACMIFCRPVFASSMEGFGLYPDAPELPFVIPTMLLRPFRPIWRPILEFIGPLSVWLVNFVIYCFQNDGVDRNSKTTTAATSSTSLRPAGFADYGLGQDVYV